MHTLTLANCPPARIAKEYGKPDDDTRALAESVLRAEIEIYDQYLQGDVYGFIVEDADGEEVDSCRGFYGSDPDKNGMMDYMDTPELENLCRAAAEHIEYR